MNAFVERLALALFDADQANLPQFTQRKSFDDLDEASGVAARYRSRIRAILRKMHEFSPEMAEAGRRGSNPRGAAKANSIEITPEMMEAGASILLDMCECPLTIIAHRVARQVFEAMLSKQKSAWNGKIDAL